MDMLRVTVVGGGAAGFFGAIACAEARPGAAITICERGPQFLSKVRISGGGRCNVTHACFDPGELSRHYPRGGQALIGVFHRFGPAETMTWFEDRGVSLKTEADHRIFPVSDSAQTIIDCLIEAAVSRGVRLRHNCGVTGMRPQAGGGFRVELAGGEVLESDRVLLAMGGCRAPAVGGLALALGHTIEPPVPSLFTFQVPLPALNELAGISVEDVELAVPSRRLKARGALLITHTGLSGPATLRLSAWGARELHDLDHRFELRVNWFPDCSMEVVNGRLEAMRASQAARLVGSTPLPPLASRLWSYLVEGAGIGGGVRWAELPRAAEHRLVRRLMGTELEVRGKSLNKEEFVTCGGVRLSEVDFKTMESRIVRGLHFAGELLDIDGLTGGFNFQAAWSTGWIAGRALA